VESAIDGLEAELQATPDVVFAFVTSHHRAVWDALPRLLRRRFPDVTIVGCGAAGVIGGGREHEGRPAVAVTGATLPDVAVTSVHLEPEDLFRSDATAPAWLDRFRDSSVLLAIPDNSSVDGEAFIDLTNRHLPETTVLGGFASGASASGGNILFHGEEHHPAGATLLGLGGGFRMDAVIAQGCRPVGQPLFVTGAHDHLITSLDEKAPSVVLHELIEGLTPKDQELLRYSLFLGIGMAPGRNRYDVGDFLIRNVTGFDPEGGALAVAAPIQIGQVVQFHLRDAETSTRDLRKQLRLWSEREDAITPDGALLFSCLGRGQHLYGIANHDSSVIAEHLGPLPLGGFFCAGEIGPVSGQTFIHGYTSVLGLFSS
jgi:small ligand-binding sensory domain FIST